MTPSYLRLYATTDGSPVGQLALAYTKALLRLSPVSVIGIGGPVNFIGPWHGYEQLATLAREGAYINCVLTSPERWTWRMHFPMPNQDGSTTELHDRVEVWTQGVRNVLFVLATPHETPGTAEYAAQLASAAKYDAVLAPNEEISSWWRAHTGKEATVIQVPVTPGEPHLAFRRAVLGHI